MGSLIEVPQRWVSNGTERYHLSCTEGAFGLNAGTWEAKVGDRPFRGYYSSILTSENGQLKIIEETVAVGAPRSSGGDQPKRDCHFPFLAHRAPDAAQRFFSGARSNAYALQRAPDTRALETGPTGPRRKFVVHLAILFGLGFAESDVLARASWQHGLTRAC